LADAIMMRSQQAVEAGGAQAYLPPELFDPNLLGPRHHHDLLRGDALVIGLMNFALPLQPGIRDVAVLSAQCRAHA
jgi:cytochrome o ubiquinol oxidase subunit I